MFDFRPIFLVIGILLATLGCTMMLPAIIDFSQGHPDWQVFATSAGITLFIGVGMTLTSWERTGDLSLKQAFVLLTLAWVLLVAFAAVPLALSELKLSYTDAFFEAMSGMTTTGSTVIAGLDTAPPGILIWRALLQWLGGGGIIVMAIAVLPMLQTGGMQLFRLERGDTSEKILPRATQVAGSVTALYVAITVACIVGYYCAGMRVFDAVAHALATVSTGGFSTRDASLGYYDSATVDTVAVVFMLLGGLPFIPVLQAMRGRPRMLRTSSQIRIYFYAAAGLVAIAWLYQALWRGEDALLSFRHAAFNVISVMTTTGFATADYGQWGAFAVVFYFLVMFVGGCAGSTSGSIKIFRFQVLATNVRACLTRILFPHGVFEARYQGSTLPDQVSASVLSFFFLYIMCFAITALALDLIGLDTLTALSAAATAITNVGPGLGDIIGPAGNFAALPDSAKWILSAAMLLGRLELFTVLVLVTPVFWRS